MRVYNYTQYTPVNVQDYFVLNKWDGVSAYVTSKTQYQKFVDYVSTLTLADLPTLAEDVSTVNRVLFTKFTANSGSSAFSTIVISTSRKLNMLNLKQDPIMSSTTNIIPILAKLKIFVRAINYNYTAILDYTLTGNSRNNQISLNGSLDSSKIYQSSYTVGNVTYSWESPTGSLTLQNFNGGLVYNTIGGVYIPYTAAVNIGINNSLRIKRTETYISGTLISYHPVHCEVIALVEYVDVDKYTL